MRANLFFFFWGSVEFNVEIIFCKRLPRKCKELYIKHQRRHALRLLIFNIKKRKTKRITIE